MRFREQIEYRVLEDIVSSPSSDYVVVGYADDEGVRNNSGRAGARLGPQQIIHYLSKLPMHLSRPPRIIILDERLSFYRLEQRHERAYEIVSQLLKQKKKVITLGGGHDYGYPDAKAFYEFKKKQCKILNIDAHFDLRPLNLKRITSGTPFYRFAEEFGGKDLIQWGIRLDANATDLFEYAKKKKIQFYTWNERPRLVARAFGVSLCLDAIEGIRGVSAPSLYGLLGRDVLSLIVQMAAKTGYLGLYEAAPGLDPHTHDSARFAAQVMSAYIHKKEGFNEKRFLSKYR